jgi:hypothetical protein
MAVCDICNRSVEHESCYVLTTSDVVTSESYWEFAFTHQWSYVLAMDPTIILGLVKQQAAFETGWLLCEECCKCYQFDKNIARQRALLSKSNPDKKYGGANEILVTTVAMQAYLKLKKPTSSNSNVQDIRTQESNVKSQNTSLKVLLNACYILALIVFIVLSILVYPNFFKILDFFPEIDFIKILGALFLAILPFIIPLILVVPITEKIENKIKSK